MPARPCPPSTKNSGETAPTHHRAHQCIGGGRPGGRACMNDGKVETSDQVPFASRRTVRLVSCLPSAAPKLNKSRSDTREPMPCHRCHGGTPSITRAYFPDDDTASRKAHVYSVVSACQPAWWLSWELGASGLVSSMAVRARRREREALASHPRKLAARRPPAPLLSRTYFKFLSYYIHTSPLLMRYTQSSSIAQASRLR